MSRIFVTGLGIISAVGHNVEANRHSLVNKKPGIGKATFLSTKYAAALPFGEVDISTPSLKEKLNAFEKGTTRTSLLALHALDEAIKDSKLTDEELHSPRTALVGADTVGGMCLTDELHHDANKHEQGSEYLASYDCGSATLYLRDRYQIGGIVNTINTACSSSANAIMYGARLIHHGLAERAIVGGCDSLAKFTINGFNALHILADEACRPFDENRKGLNLGEGAAFLVLEKEGLVTNDHIYAELSGYGNSNDAFHASSLSDNGEGPLLAMKEALMAAKLPAGEIDYINAHGTGTENNDEAESRAMIRLFGQVPLFSSTKAYTGHTLGAAGAIEAAYSILSLYHGEVYPGANFSKPMAATGLLPVTVYLKKELRHVMSNSFGFGGNCSSLIFSRA
ncbi:MAG: beta-ketoacyl-[acyl-carrier-protein] synthase family protein [Bacteroidetes bacterium]|nr:beta-ketoacyl-[acyl-carrier-protein] synthase family protein [Bacteroidota bacterium]MBS1974278.1 beta-ketoacyl-[acyl-carrier-protein] synthase family protein [Bacteroidota bacterium]